MRNVFDESCRENQNTHFMFNIFFSKILPFILSKNVVVPERPQMASQYGAYELHAGYARLHTQTRSGTRTHTQICNTYCFSTATMIRVRASLVRYTYIACLCFPIGMTLVTFGRTLDCFLIIHKKDIFWTVQLLSFSNRRSFFWDLWIWAMDRSFCRRSTRIWCHSVSERGWVK
jgi:hypothetical protein